MSLIRYESYESSLSSWPSWPLVVAITCVVVWCIRPKRRNSPEGIEMLLENLHDKINDQQLKLNELLILQGTLSQELRRQETYTQELRQSQEYHIHELRRRVKQLEPPTEEVPEIPTRRFLSSMRPRL